MKNHTEIAINALFHWSQFVAWVNEVGMAMNCELLVRGNLTGIHIKQGREDFRKPGFSI